MNKLCTRVLLLLLALVLCVGTLACANEPDDDPEKPAQPGTPSEENPDDDKEPQILPDVEKKDYDCTINFMHYTVEGKHESYIVWNEICPEEGVDGHIGNIIEDAVFDRTAWLEENYGITLTNYYQAHDKLPTVVANLISSGTDEYQVLVEFGFDAQRVMGKNYFQDLAVMPNLDFSKPWWVQESIDNLAIGDFVEFAASDLLILDKGATSMMFYNIPMADNLGLDSFYSLVNDGEWTIEALASAAELAYQDNGNDQRDELDTFGIICGDDPVLMLYLGAGQKFIAKDDDGEYYYSYGYDSETLEIMTTILSDIMYQDFYWNGWLTRNDVADQPEFKDGQSLFYFNMAKACNALRNMTDNYGILPIPKYDDSQDNYYSQVSGYHDSLIAVFNTAGGGDSEKLEAIGAALEVLSYYSYYNVYPQFYEVVIQGRGTRDNESRDMLDKIFSTRTYDLGLVYDPIGFTDNVLRYTAKGDTNLSSFMATWDSKITEMVKDLNELASTYW